MARGVASVTLPITNLEIAVPLSAMNWFLVHSWINFASFRVFSSFYRSFSFSFSLLFYRSSSSLSLGWYQFCQLFILIFNIFKNYQKNYLYLYLVTSTKWILLRGSLGNNKGKGWRSIGRIKRENSGIVSDGFGRRERVGTAINIVVQYNAALENSGRVKGPWGVGPEIGVEMFVRPFAGSRVVPLFLSFFFSFLFPLHNNDFSLLRKNQDGPIKDQVLRRNSVPLNKMRKRFSFVVTRSRHARYRHPFNNNIS